MIINNNTSNTQNQVRLYDGQNYCETTIEAPYACFIQATKTAANIIKVSAELLGDTLGSTLGGTLGGTVGQLTLMAERIGDTVRISYEGSEHLTAPVNASLRQQVREAYARYVQWRA